MSREVHVPFCERPRGRFPRPTHHKVHWILDVAFLEDKCKVRKDNGPENFSVLRRLTTNLIKAGKEVKAGVKNRRLLAGWDDEYLLSLLAQSVK
jgi:hypothetical protein